MSMQTSHVYGYGFNVYASDANLANFIKNHENVVAQLDRGREILDYIDNVDCLDSLKEDFFDYENEMTGDEGLYGIIIDIMYKETGIRFSYRVPQDEDDDVIMFEETYPWLCNDVEKDLTVEKLDEIFKKYIKELCIAEEPDYVELEYFG